MTQAAWRIRVDPTDVAEVAIHLYAKGPGTPVLIYLGGAKFATRGRPAEFTTTMQAMANARVLQRQFPMLRKYKLWAV